MIDLKMSWQVMLWNIGHNRKSPLSLGASSIPGERQTSPSKLAKSCKVPSILSTAWFPPFFLENKVSFSLYGVEWTCPNRQNAFKSHVWGTIFQLLNECFGYLKKLRAFLLFGALGALFGLDSRLIFNKDCLKVGMKSYHQKPKIQ